MSPLEYSSSDASTRETAFTTCLMRRAEGRDFVVQVVGDVPSRRRYAAHARRLGLGDHIEWHGLLREGRARLYREATLLAAPCTIASFGVVLLEAMASGIPIVCADNVGFRQVIRDGAPGRFVSPSNPVDLARGIGAVLDDDALRADWARNGRSVAETRYAWPRVAIEGIYLEALAGPDRALAHSRRAVLVGAN